MSCQVMQFLESQEYNMFTRIVFDTAPTVRIFYLLSLSIKDIDFNLTDIFFFFCSQGHTLRLLSLPDFLDASIGKILKVKSPSLDYNALWPYQPDLSERSKSSFTMLWYCNQTMFVILLELAQMDEVFELYSEGKRPPYWKLLCWQLCL